MQYAYIWHNQCVTTIGHSYLEVGGRRLLKTARILHDFAIVCEAFL